MIYKVKTYSLPDLTYLGTLRVRNPSAENIAKRMGGKISKTQGALPTLDFRDGRRIMYRIMPAPEPTKAKLP
jgi:hypothetical protein